MRDKKNDLETHKHFMRRRNKEQVNYSKRKEKMRQFMKINFDAHLIGDSSNKKICTVIFPQQTPNNN